MSEPTRVRVVVVNYNGGDLTVRCVESLLASEWPDDQLEIVVVDNASSDDVVARLGRDHPRVRVVPLSENRGFGAGCNVGMRDLRGVEYVALVNPDTLVDSAWLAPLVARLESDDGLGAVSPKILLGTPYRAVDLCVSGRARPGRGLLRLTGVRIGGRDVSTEVRFGSGWSGPDGSGEPGRWVIGREARLMVPVIVPAPATVDLHLIACRPGATVRPGSGTGTSPVAVTDKWLQVGVDTPPQELVNSAGVVLGDDGVAADRGYLEPDEGQYDPADEVDAWSGAAVLLRRAYIEDVGPFDERLFLYYEDVDLSLRGRALGWRYGYAPSSVVRHAHSASTVVDSPLVSYYNDRNRLLVLARHGSPRAVAAATGRFLAVTAAYARRDLQGLVPGARCVPERGRTLPRIRAFTGFLRRLPALAAHRARGH